MVNHQIVGVVGFFLRFEDPARESENKTGVHDGATLDLLPGDHQQEV